MLNSNQTFLVLVLSFLVLCNLPSVHADAKDDHEATEPSVRTEFTFDGRRVEVILPAGFKARTRYPLLVYLHGATIESTFGLSYTGYDQLPAHEKVIVVGANGLLHPIIGDGVDFTYWNGTDACCAFEVDFGPQPNDVAYLNDLLDELETRYPIDARRIYFAGESNGGFMAYRMACDAADRVAAIVSFAGATFFDPADCHPSEAVSVLQVHGDIDATIKFEGGTLGQTPIEYPSAPQSVATWANYNGCTGALYQTGRRLDIAEGNRLEGPTELPGKDTSVSKQKGCSDGVGVELWTVEQANHVPFLTTHSDGTTNFANETWKWLKKRRKGRMFRIRGHFSHSRVSLPHREER